MKRGMMLFLAGAAIGFLFCHGAPLVRGAEKKSLADVDVNALTRETQKTLGTKDALNIVWVIPVEFWQASLARDARLADFQRQALIDALSKYLIVAVVRTDISPLGVFRFHDEKKVFDSLHVSFAKNKDEPAPLKLLLKADNEDAQAVIDSIKPILKAALGKMGDNFHFFVGNAEDQAGRRLLSPYETGKLRVTLDTVGLNAGGVVEIAFPLDALYVPRVCANCRSQARISWSYCPFCGNRLPH